jgi:hypothetical protein
MSGTSTMVTHGKPKQAMRWWLEETPAERAAAIERCAGAAWRSLTSVRSDMYKYASMYEEMPFIGASPRAFRRRRVMQSAPILSLNVAKACSDTYVAMVTDAMPKTSFFTNGGEPDLQRQCKTMQMFVDGVRQALDLPETFTELNFDVCKFGTGLIQVYAGGDPKAPEICADRVMPWDWLTLEQESSMRKQRNEFRIHRMDRALACERWPDKKRELESASSLTFDDGASYESEELVLGDTINIVEAWHMPYFEGGEGGVHAFSVGDEILAWDAYPYIHSNIVPLYRQLPTMGVYGLSLCKELAGLQKAINRLLRDLTKAEALIVGHWLVDAASEINTAALNDQLGVIRYRGNQPVFYAPSPNSPSAYQQLDRLYGKSFEIIGVPTMMAQGQKPPGLNSGEAIRSYADVTTKRFKPSYKLFQSFGKRVDELVVRTAREISEKNRGFEVKAMGREGMTTLRASKSILDDNKFAIQIAETNLMADDPSSKYETVQEMMGSSLVTPMTGRRMLTGIPDIKEEMSLENASYDAVTTRLDKILRDGEYSGPEPIMQLADLPTGDPGAITLATNFLLKAENDNEPQEKRDLLIRWLTEAQDLLTMAQGPAPNTAGAAPGAQMTPGQAQPVAA